MWVGVGRFVCVYRFVCEGACVGEYIVGGWVVGALLYIILYTVCILQPTANHFCTNT